MSFINKEELLEELKNKKFCKHCVYVGRNNKCFYPSETGCSPIAMLSAIIQFIDSLEVKRDDGYLVEKKYTNDLLQMNYIATFQKYFDEALDRDPEKVKEELIQMGVLNEDGTGKDSIVDE